MWREWLIFPKALFSGVVAVVVMWVAILFYSTWQNTLRSPAARVTGLGAVSGGWTALLHSLPVLLLLTIAFAIGLYLASRR